VPVGFGSDLIGADVNEGKEFSEARAAHGMSFGFLRENNFLEGSANDRFNFPLQKVSR